MTGVQIALTGIVMLLALRGWSQTRGEEPAETWTAGDAIAGMVYIAAALSIPVGIILAIWSLA